MRAPTSALRPTPPRPITATEEPGSIAAVFTTAPTPVSTAQPNMAAVVSGSPLSTLTAERRETTAWVENADTPTW